MNTLDYTVANLGDALAGVVTQVIYFLPSLIIAIVLVIIGFVFGSILGRAVSHLVSILKIDRALDKAGLSKVMHGNMRITVSDILGGLVKWSVIISFLMAATQQLGMDAFAGFLWEILAYIPNVIVAALILVSTFLLADFVGKLVEGSAGAAGMKGGAAGAVAHYAILIVGVLAALAQLKIATGFMEILFTGLVAAISLALGLAFGLGGRDAAGRAIEKVEHRINS